MKFKRGTHDEIFEGAPKGILAGSFEHMSGETTDRIIGQNLDEIPGGSPKIIPERTFKIILEKKNY